ncbi:hypothetical protein [Bacillus sp. T33-2]|uniref:hypothetical protein n=1 Tax=Bacillus sp. T33-2 TaxID=2054168 RepID=UPI000C78DAEB|nr:hypothetical protein [Bacillus sp. T33-2]PLR99523.1 hypothetical protein CVD19_00235 [Bacillus sp. T33-2]
MKLLKVTDDVFQYYKENVRGNKDITLDQARRKLTRNVMLAKKVVPKDDIQRIIGTKIYHYGNLHITVRWNKVIHIVNHRSGKHYGGWKLDRRKYEQLTKELGIQDDKFAFYA